MFHRKGLRGVYLSRFRRNVENAGQRVGDGACGKRLCRFEYILLLFDSDQSCSSFVSSRKCSRARVHGAIVAKLFANGLILFLEAILMPDSLKLLVSVEKDAVLLGGAERFICLFRTRSCVSRGSYRAESNFRAARFTRPGTLSTADRCYTATRGYVTMAVVKIYYPPLNLLAVCRYGRREKRPDTNDFHGRPTFYIVRCRAGEINGKRSPSPPRANARMCLCASVDTHGLFPQEPYFSFHKNAQ